MVEFIPMLPAHLDDVWAIEQRAHPFPWTESQIRETPGRFALNLTLLIDGEVAGYCFGQSVAGEASLLNIAVDPQRQGQGLGRQLLAAFVAAAQAEHAEEIWLEVRASNVRASQLYLANGFTLISRRENYYRADSTISATGREDALMMKAEL
ncbi:ribosomal protein S18-alanine N-acetyltransferase [Photobacterium galatheae]|uniref:[Ribosomal protein bS18]-alanine N-acetyltransferase n=1 Tax=Photobacterium galatheae TaxID=1654360 RepID=A0A066RRU8_9GAMM|nr:ribosomal protein S18-alanine N-acetyltransferase [Photobacterium galatheae]KDM91836.1 alanine acetyltransferase [Photobacterium galatheae]MCM0147755.1 ribosomal protein S18-alanine N-acetyltransferase [Photobacterium galatheae]